MAKCRRPSVWMEWAVWIRRGGREVQVDGSKGYNLYRSQEYNDCVTMSMNSGWGWRTTSKAPLLKTSENQSDTTEIHRVQYPSRKHLNTLSEIHQKTSERTNPEKIWLWWFFHGTLDLCCFFLRKDISRGKRRPKVPVDCGNMCCFWTLAAILIVRTQAHLCTSFASFNWSSVAEVSSTKIAQRG